MKVETMKNENGFDLDDAPFSTSLDEAADFDEDALAIRESFDPTAPLNDSGEMESNTGLPPMDADFNPADVEKSW